MAHDIRAWHFNGHYSACHETETDAPKRHQDCQKVVTEFCVRLNVLNLFICAMLVVKIQKNVIHTKNYKFC